MAQITINEDEYMGSQGLLYGAERRFLGVANGGTVDIIIKAGSYPIFVSFAADSDGKYLIDSYFEDDYTGGVALVPFNFYPSGAVATEATIVTQPTINVAGTKRGERLNGSGVGAQSVGGSSSNRETKLEANESLRLRLTNDAGVSADMALAVYFHR